MNNIFHFKEFKIDQSDCAMKVNTDGVLLAALIQSENPKKILDIGTGTGLIALMLAQRFSAATIDAVEIDQKAANRAGENFSESPFSDRLKSFHSSIEDFFIKNSELYDLIVSNPPFYSEDYRSENQQRDLARFQEAMPFEDLIDAAALLLSENGIFSVIIPYKVEERFIDLCAEVELFPIKVTRVKGSHKTPIVRSLLAFKRYELAVLVADELVIEINRHEYTDDYIELTNAFYLKM